MKRRHLINVWPAFADLMTVLAVCGLFTTLAVSQINSSSKEELLAKIRDSEQRRQLLEEVKAFMAGKTPKSAQCETMSYRDIRAVGGRLATASEDWRQIAP